MHVRALYYALPVQLYVGIPTTYVVRVRKKVVNVELWKRHFFLNNGGGGFVPL